MQKKILAFFFLLIIAYMVTTCSTNLESSLQDLSSPNTTNNTEEVFVFQDTSETESSSESESLENDETQEEDECPIVLFPSEQNPRVECAKLYNITGKIEYTDKQDGTGLENIRKLSTYKRNGWLGKEEALLNGIYNQIEVSEAGNKLLFNTLEMFSMGEKTEFIFRKNQKIDRHEQTDIRSEGLITLNLGEIVVSSAGMKGPHPIGATNINQSSILSLTNKHQDRKVKQSFLQRLWHNGKHYLSQLRTTLLPNGFIAQPVLANEVDNSLLDTPTLKVETPEAKILSNGAVYVVKRDKQRERTQIFSLTEQPLMVVDEYGKEVILSRNQTVVVDKNGLLEEAYEFRLCGFYRDNQELLQGFAPREVDFVRQQPRDMQFAYHGARSLTVPLYHRNCQRRCAPRGS